MSRRTNRARSRSRRVTNHPISRLRLLAVGVIFTIILSGFGYRLVDLQISPDPALSAGLWYRFRSDDLAAARGKILDRKGRTLAHSLPAPTIVANPRLVMTHEVNYVVAQLTSLVSTPPEILASRLERDKVFAYVERQVDADVGDAVESLDIKGIRIDSEYRRRHPAGDCSGIAVVGRVDIDHQGISGLEEAYDTNLAGIAGKVVREANSDGSITIPDGHQSFKPANPGSDLRLTLDRNVQFRAERILKETVTEAQAERGIIVAAIPQTGEIVAVANVVRDPSTGEVGCTTANLGMVWAYEPGSIMKPITVAAVLDADLATPFESIELPDRLDYQLEDQRTKTYVDWFTHERSHYSPTDIVVKSSNIGAITLAQRLGPVAFHDALIDFGFGSKTSLDFKGEASGILEPLNSNILELNSVAIGQSIAVTPIQMLQAYSVIANGGRYIEPVLVADEVGLADARRIVGEDTANAVLKMMETVVAEGTGRRAVVSGYDVAGKTGTAWQPCEHTVGYDCDGARHYTASFAGILSNDDGPALTVLVVIDDPRGEHYGGGLVAAPVFREFASYALRQLGIPPMGLDTAGGRVRAHPTFEAVVVNDSPGTDVQ